MPALVCAKGATNLCARVQWTACTLGVLHQPAAFKYVRLMPGVCALLQALGRFGYDHGDVIHKAYKPQVSKVQMTEGDVVHWNKEQARHGACLLYTMCPVYCCFIRSPQGSCLMDKCNRL